MGSSSNGFENHNQLSVDTCSNNVHENHNNFNKLNIYTCRSQKKLKIIQDNFKEKNFNFFDKDYEDIKDILSDIEEKFKERKTSSEIEYNIILELLDENEIIEKKKNSIISILENKIDKTIRPIVILGIKNKVRANDNSYQMSHQTNNEKGKNKNNIQNNTVEKLRNSDISNEYIEFAYYDDDNYREIFDKIKQLYRYYNNIGDIYTIMNEKLGQPNIDKFCEKNNFKNIVTLNILVIGRFGAGKSTLINILLDEKKAHTGVEFLGKSNTKFFSRYVHPKHPIVFIDTPGIENKCDYEKIQNYLLDTKEFYGYGKNKIHIVLYIINSSDVRYFNKDEIELIKLIIANMKIPIFFVCTRALNKEYAANNKEFVKINLKQIFGINTYLTEFIYSCQLLDEKDGIYKRFGIEELLGAIHDIFINSKYNPENIRKNFINAQKNESKSLSHSIREFPLFNLFNNNNQNFDDKIIFNSLKNFDYNFKKYLNNLCEKIIINYYNYAKSKKEADNQGKDKEKNKNLICLLINHLAYELNGDLFDEKIKNIMPISGNDISNNEASLSQDNKNFFSIEEIKTKGFEAKNIFLKSLEESFQYYISDNAEKKENLQSPTGSDKSKEISLPIQSGINNYFNYLIDEYKKAIESFKHIYKNN